MFHVYRPTKSSFLCLLIFPIDISQQWYCSAFMHFFSSCVHNARIDFHFQPLSYPFIFTLHPKQICHSCHLQFMFKLAQINLIILPQIFGCFLMWKFVFADVFPLVFSHWVKRSQQKKKEKFPRSMTVITASSRWCPPHDDREKRYIIFHPFSSERQQQ